MMIAVLIIPVLAAGDDEVSSNLGFHCRAFGGNGKVDTIPAYVKGTEEQFQRLSGNIWKLVSDQYVCAKCGRNEWVTYSNSNGVFDGGNIQVSHPSSGEWELLVIKQIDGVIATGMEGMFTFRLEHKSHTGSNNTPYTEYGTAEIGNDGIARFVIEYGMDYRITEVNIPADYTDITKNDGFHTQGNVPNPKIIYWDNSYTPLTGNVEVSFYKYIGVDWNDPGEDEEFKFTLSKRGSSFEEKLTNNGNEVSYTFSWTNEAELNALVGRYSITEDYDANWISDTEKLQFKLVRDDSGSTPTLVVKWRNEFDENQDKPVVVNTPVTETFNLMVVKKYSGRELPGDFRIELTDPDGLTETLVAAGEGGPDESYTESGITTLIWYFPGVKGGTYTATEVNHNIPGTNRTGTAATVSGEMPDQNLGESNYQLVLTLENYYTTTPPPDTPTTTTTRPDTGSLTVTKTFNINVVPADWNATVIVTGPNGYSAQRTITGANRSFTLSDLAPGEYVVTESSPGAIAGYVYIDTTGEGGYTVTVGNTTAATITNNYDQEFVFTPPETPLVDNPEDDDFEEMFIGDAPTPLGEMPNTGIEDTVALWFLGLCLTMLTTGASKRLIDRLKAADRRIR